jgi:hypothetical protein
LFHLEQHVERLIVGILLLEFDLFVEGFEGLEKFGVNEVVSGNLVEFFS